VRLTFPHIGEVYIPLKAILNGVGIDTVAPPLIGPETITLGVKHAPEFICFPFKVNLGNYIQAIQSGADTILMAGGCGPCRFGNYAEIQREILRGLGYDIRFIILEPPSGKGPPFWEELRRFMGWQGLLRLPSALRLGWEKMKLLDLLDQIVFYLHPRETTAGTALAFRSRYRRQIDDAQMMGVLRRIASRIRQEAEEFECHPEKQVLRVKVGGEIYMVLEPNVNLHLDDELGRMGVEVHRSISLSNWVRENLLALFHRDKLRNHAGLAKAHLRCFVGGHGQNTVAEAVDAGINRYDGMIQVMPFTCMPELVAQSILPEVSREYKLPILSLVIDEHAGEAGIRTRLEAFVDLVRRCRLREVMEA
jgi:predicted nucleotide-binding protein (sugar kinase/HSP70/actin superfamily)